MQPEDIKNITFYFSYLTNLRHFNINWFNDEENGYWDFSLKDIAYYFCKDFNLNVLNLNFKYLFCLNKYI